MVELLTSNLFLRGSVVETFWSISYLTASSETVFFCSILNCYCLHSCFHCYPDLPSFYFLFFTFPFVHLHTWTAFLFYCNSICFSWSCIPSPLVSFFYLFLQICWNYSWPRTQKGPLHNNLRFTLFWYVVFGGNVGHSHFLLSIVVLFKPNHFELINLVFEFTREPLLGNWLRTCIDLGEGQASI